MNNHMNHHDTNDEKTIQEIEDKMRDRSELDNTTTKAYYRNNGHPSESLKRWVAPN